MTSEVSPPHRRLQESLPAIAHPRGRIAPPLPKGSPLWKRLGRASIRVAQGLYFHDAFRVAPAMAFHFFLSLMPLLVFIGWGLSRFVERNGLDAVLLPFVETLPASTRMIIEHEAHRLSESDRLGPLAAVGFLWIASGGMHGLIEAVEAVVGAPRRSWLKQRFIALTWVVVVLGGIAGASFGVIQWEDVFHRSAPSSAAVSSERSREPPSVASDPKSILHGHPMKDAVTRVRRSRMLRDSGERVLALIFSLAGAIVALAVFYWLSVSHSKRVARRVFPGAALAVALWIVISWGFGLYVKTLTDYAVFYGSLAAVAVLLLWLWLTSLAILVGAELNAQLEGLRD